MEKQTCPADPYAEYTKFPFSSFPPHLRMAEARKVALMALCATENEGIWVRGRSMHTHTYRHACTFCRYYEPIRQHPKGFKNLLCWPLYGTTLHCVVYWCSWHSLNLLIVKIYNLLTGWDLHRKWGLPWNMNLSLSLLCLPNLKQRKAPCSQACLTLNFRKEEKIEENWVNFNKLS